MIFQKKKLKNSYFNQIKLKQKQFITFVLHLNFKHMNIKIFLRLNLPCTRKPSIKNNEDIINISNG